MLSDIFCPVSAAHALQVGGTPKPAKSVTKNVFRVLKWFAGCDSLQNNFSTELQDQNFTFKKNLSSGTFLQKLDQFFGNFEFPPKIAPTPFRSLDLPEVCWRAGTKYDRIFVVLVTHMNFSPKKPNNVHIFEQKMGSSAGD